MPLDTDGNAQVMRAIAAGRRAALLTCVASALSGCAAVEYYWQGMAGQFDLLSRAQPISEVAASTADPALRKRLERTQAIRAFASRELALPDNGSYTRYADLGRAYVVWNVFAAPELSLVARQWCFPVAGCVAYRGYFVAAYTVSTKGGFVGYGKACVSRPTAAWRAEANRRREAMG